MDAQEKPYAVEKGIINQIDIAEALTPLNLDHIIAQTQPDLILLTQATEDLGLGDAPGMGLMADALRDELVSISEVPMIEVARTASR